MFANIDFQEILSAFLVLIGIIDIVGSIPIILQLKAKGRTVSAPKATLISFALMVGFFYGGSWILKIFGCNIESFATAGSILILLMSLEMILDVEIFKNTGPIKEATLVPLVFPLLAGAGTFTTLISIGSMYHDINILIGLALNMVWVYIVIKMTDRVQKILGVSGIYFIRKFFGIILMAISVKMFMDNITKLLQ
ncbi:MAG: MarC family protein [Bacteroidales bacterium]|nr:MarC family protein [Candidatus Sodaliphilus aphodohippi]